MSNPFLHLEDEKLMELYAHGEYLAFEVIYLRHKNKVYSFLSRRLKDKSSIDDVFQNIFIKFHKSKERYDRKYPLIKWLYTLSRNELLDHLKKRQITEVEFNEQEWNHSSAENLGESFSENVKSIDLSKEKRLSEKERKALDLKFYSDQDYHEISVTLRTSQVNVRKIISRGLKKLRLKYGGEGL